MTRDEAIARLCDLLPPGSRVYTVLRTVSRSGRTRTLDVYTFFDNNDGTCVSCPLTDLVAAALEIRRTKTGALIVNFQASDVGFELVHQLSFLLHGMLSKRDGQQPEAGIPCDVSQASDYRAGYSLHQAWL